MCIVDAEQSNSVNGFTPATSYTLSHDISKNQIPQTRENETITLTESAKINAGNIFAESQRDHRQHHTSETQSQRKNSGDSPIQYLKLKRASAEH